jgi:OFA family oxalate/formate antiporter-like MFS transporter
MGIVFTLGAFAYWGLGSFGYTPYMFILLARLIFFTWGEIFSLFPAIATDAYGAKYATANAGLFYTAKGTAVWVVPWPASSRITAAVGIGSSSSPRS